jgi:hypothetical protein
MKYTPGYRTIKEVVASVMNERGDYGNRQAKRMRIMAIEGFSEFNMLHISRPIPAWIKVNKNLNSIPYPDDLISLISIGIPINGKYWDFKRITDAINPKKDFIQEGRSEGEGKDFQPANTFASTGGYNPYQFQEDESNRRAILYGVPVDEVLIYYRTSGIKLGEETLIPAHAFEALKAYVKWKLIEDKDGVAYSEKERKYMIFAGKLKDMRDYENSFSPEEFVNAIRQGYSQGIKR